MLFYCSSHEIVLHRYCIYINGGSLAVNTPCFMNTLMKQYLFQAPAIWHIIDVPKEKRSAVSIALRQFVVTMDVARIHTDYDSSSKLMLLESQSEWKYECVSLDRLLYMLVETYLYKWSRITAWTQHSLQLPHSLLSHLLPSKSAYS